ncbi:hypothetical protein LVJ83_05885 [Uruburuella testudinis]|uniref:Uncharacterized protein n=1 Tax=Uruburuella testudinis TaxID=1282863 RepID=A0ABY4E205_9NEIS|nr:hypothetical protein [Uruburuella testudinis]UOO82986.1 hypothetical protein LVJ83_05885 [Uruburuella testudinis]
MLDKNHVVTALADGLYSSLKWLAILYTAFFLLAAAALLYAVFLVLQTLW